MSYISNLQIDDAKRRDRREFAASIREAAASPALAVIRIRCRTTLHGTRFHNVVGYTAALGHVRLDVEQQAAVTVLMFGRRPDIDWNHDHDYHLDAAMLRRSPTLQGRGAVPSVARRFGGSDPVFLPPGVRWGDPVTIPAQRASTETS